MSGLAGLLKIMTTVPGAIKAWNKHQDVFLVVQVVSKKKLFTPIPGELIQFDEQIFQMGWNHQLAVLENF